MLDPKQCKPGEIVICHDTQGQYSSEFTEGKLYKIIKVETPAIIIKNNSGTEGCCLARKDWFKKFSGKLAKHLYEN